MVTRDPDTLPTDQVMAGHASPRGDSAPDDPTSTAQRLLAAAAAEFVRHGYAGARVDRIALVAGANKRMLYHYFGDKQGIYAAVLQRKILAEPAFGLEVEAATGDELAQWLSQFRVNAEQARLMAWEGLQPAVSTTTAATTGLTPGVEVDSLRAELDPALVALLFLSLDLVPQVCGPTVARLTGRDPNSAEFAVDVTHFKEQLSRRLRRPPIEKTKVVLRANSRPSSNSEGSS